MATVEPMLEIDVRSEMELLIHLEWSTVVYLCSTHIPTIFFRIISILCEKSSLFNVGRFTKGRKWLIFWINRLIRNEIFRICQYFDRTISDMKVFFFDIFPFFQNRKFKKSWIVWNISERNSNFTFQTTLRLHNLQNSRFRTYTHHTCRCADDARIRPDTKKQLFMLVYLFGLKVIALYCVSGFGVGNFNAIFGCSTFVFIQWSIHLVLFDFRSFKFISHSNSMYMCMYVSYVWCVFFIERTVIAKHKEDAQTF